MAEPERHGGPARKGWDEISDDRRRRIVKGYGGSERKAKRAYESGRRIEFRPSRRPQLPAAIRNAPHGREVDPRHVRKVTMRPQDEGPSYVFTMDDGSDITVDADYDTWGPEWRWIRQAGIEHEVDSP